jgi:hypothetical protein
MSGRAGALLDDARDALLALGRTGAGDVVSGIAADGVRRIEWSGSWLDDPYVPRARTARTAGPPDDLGSVERRLRGLTDAFEALVEEFEEEDPVRNANGVQTGSLAFAITGATAARLRRLGAARPRDGRIDPV